VEQAMGRISKTKRFEILARDGFRCQYCGASPADARLHVDHSLAVARGGTDDDANLITACADCNHGKSDGVLIPTRRGFEVDQSAKMARSKKWAASIHPAVDPNRHVLDTGQIDSLDEEDDDSQLALVWCESHQKYEWHNIPQRLIGHTSELVRITRPGWKGAI
jgi:hypothetical protein